MWLNKIFVAVVCFSLFSGVSLQKTCVKKYFDQTSSFVCVCNSTYCDEFPRLPLPLGGDDVVVYTSSFSDKRFAQTMLKFDSNSTNPSNATITVDGSQKFQPIIGFGGAFTDSTGYNVFTKLQPASQANWIDAYFGPQGIGYNLGRVPISSCDFSPRMYSYDDPPPGYTPENYTDFNLTNFALASEDFQYKIALIRKAQEYVGNELKLFATPWSAPDWMKTS